MEILLDQVGKRFNFNWIFNNVDLRIASGEHKAITGSNGSGKSTMLQILGGAQVPSTGKIRWKLNGEGISDELVYQFISIASPYLELIEDFTLKEHIDFHFSVKQPIKGLDTELIISRTGLKHVLNRRVSYFSSGMKQRLKLALAIMSDTPLLLLDEPLSNLDKKAASWYSDLINEYGTGRTIIVCSNSQQDEYAFCTSVLNMDAPVPK